MFAGGSQPLLRDVPEDLVLTLHQAVLELQRFEMAQPDVVRKWSEQRDAGADKDGNLRDDQLVNQALAKETLDGLPAINVQVPESTFRETPDYFPWRRRHNLDPARDGVGDFYVPTAENDHGHFAVRPRAEGQRQLVGAPPHDDRIHRIYELLIPVILAPLFITPVGKSVNATILSRDKPIHACRDVYGSSHALLVVVLVA
jgi:hypothetical protein